MENKYIYWEGGIMDRWVWIIISFKEEPHEIVIKLFSEFSDLIFRRNCFYIYYSLMNLIL